MGGVVNHLGQVVTDLARSRRFYEDVLDFTYWREFEAPDGLTENLLRLPAPVGLKAVYLRNGAFVLELIAYDGVETNPYQKRVMNDPGLTHLSVSVDDIPAALVKVAEYGGTVLEDTNVELAVYVRDPDGQLIELLTQGYRESLPA